MKYFPKTLFFRTSHLCLELLSIDGGRRLREAIDPGRDGALVGEVPGDATLVLRARLPDERRMENEAVLGRVPPRLEGPEERLLRAQDLHRGGRILGQVSQ